MKLQFTNNYQPRFDQISRILQYLFNQEGKRKVSHNDITTTLGIPEKQLESLISMMIGFGLVIPRTTLLTDFGKVITQSDPYFEKIETLWIIHYIVSSNPKWIVWHRIINQVIPAQNTYNVDEISKKYFSDLVIHFSEKTIKDKLPKEIRTVFVAYTRSQLSLLKILEMAKAGTYVKSTPVDIPPLAFLYSLLVYRDAFSPGSSAMNVTEICNGENSPGKVFYLTDYQVREITGRLHDLGIIRLEQFANLNQIRIPDSLTKDKVLALIYKN